MEKTKVHNDGEMKFNEPAPPPPYSSEPPPGSISYGPPQPGVDVIGTQVGVVIIGQQISAKPTRLICKACNNDIMTRVESKATWMTHFYAGLLCVLGGVFCVWIPYCTNCGSNSDHYCPNCNAYIGTYVG